MFGDQSGHADDFGDCGTPCGVELDGAIFCLLSRFDYPVASVDDPVQEQTGIFLVRKVEIVSTPHLLGCGSKMAL
jgi:hypothetical protein